MSDEITIAEFEDRLIRICAGGPITGLPRRQRDQAVVLASAILWMEVGAVYTERDVNDGLRRWLEEVCPSLRVDFVTLRRELVDRNYLDRDASGRHYTLGRGPASLRFDDRIVDVDPAMVIMGAIEKREDRRRTYLEEGGVDV